MPGPFSLSCICVREDKVCGDGEEVHRESRMICSVQGLCIDLIYFASLVIIGRVGVLFLTRSFLEAAFQVTVKDFHRKRKLIFTVYDATITRGVFYKFFWGGVCLAKEKSAALPVSFSDEMFKVNLLLRIKAVNWLLGPIIRHDMQTSIFQQIL